MEKFFLWNINLFTLLLALTGQFSLNTHFNKNSRVLLAVGIFWSFCRIGAEMLVYGVSGYSNWKSVNIHPVDRLEYLLFSLYILTNTLFCMALSFYPNGFHSFLLCLKQLDNCKFAARNSKKAILILLALYVQLFLPCIVIMTYIAFSLDYDASVDKYWYMFSTRHTTAFRVFMYVVPFLVLPYASLFFHFLFLVKVLAIFNKFYAFNQILTEQTQTEKICNFQTSEDLQKVENTFKN